MLRRNKDRRGDGAVNLRKCGDIKVRASILGGCERRSERGDCVDEMAELDVISRCSVQNNPRGLN